MKKEITIPALPNASTGLQQRKKLTNMSMDLRSGFFGIYWKTEQLNLAGEVVEIVGHNEEGKAEFHAQQMSTPGGTFGTEIPQEIKDAVDAISAILEPIFAATAAPTQEKEVENED